MLIELANTESLMFLALGLAGVLIGVRKVMRGRKAR
jgi:hypothetical protein